MSYVKKIAGYVIKIALALVIIYLLLHYSNASWSDFAQLSVSWLIFSAFAQLVQNVGTGVRWYFLMKSIGIEISFYKAISLTMQGIFFSLFIPAGAVSGDLVKGTMLGLITTGEQRFNGILSIIADRLAGFGGLLVSVLVAVPLFLPKILTFPVAAQWTVWIVTICSALGICCIAALFFYQFFLKVGLFLKIWNWCDKKTGGFFGKMAHVIDLYRKAWKSFILWTFLSGFILFPMYALSYWAIIRGMKSVPENAFLGSLFASTIANVVSILPITPGGMGTRDTAFSIICNGFNISSEICSVTAAVFSIVLIVVSSVGAIFMVLDRHTK